MNMYLAAFGIAKSSAANKHAYTYTYIHVHTIYCKCRNFRGVLVFADFEGA